MTSQVASVSWAVASFLSEEGLCDWRPTVHGGDTFIESWASTEIEDDAILIRTESATTEYGVEGYTSILTIVVRGSVNSQMETMYRAAKVYKALLNIPAPIAKQAGDGISLILCGSWPTPPMVNRYDDAGRPEVLLAVRLSHSDPTDVI